MKHGEFILVLNIGEFAPNNLCTKRSGNTREIDAMGRLEKKNMFLIRIVSLCMCKYEIIIHIVFHCFCALILHNGRKGCKFGLF